jgi:hypothetical protein
MVFYPEERIRNGRLPTLLENKVREQGTGTNEFIEQSVDNIQQQGASQ